MIYELADRNWEENGCQNITTQNYITASNHCHELGNQHNKPHTKSSTALNFEGRKKHVCMVSNLKKYGFTVFGNKYTQPHNEHVYCVQPL